MKGRTIISSNCLWPVENRLNTLHVYQKRISYSWSKLNEAFPPTVWSFWLLQQKSLRCQVVRLSGKSWKSKFIYTFIKLVDVNAVKTTSLSCGHQRAYFLTPEIIENYMSIESHRETTQTGKKPNNSEKNPSQFNFVHHKSNMGRRGHEVGSPPWEVSN
jgi:hypothetical protein